MFSLLLLPLSRCFDFFSLLLLFDVLLFFCSSLFHFSHIQTPERIDLFIVKLQCVVFSFKDKKTRIRNRQHFLRLFFSLPTSTLSLLKFRGGKNDKLKMTFLEIHTTSVMHIERIVQPNILLSFGFHNTNTHIFLECIVDNKSPSSSKKIHIKWAYTIQLITNGWCIVW